jgi:hypothetical protein
MSDVSAFASATPKAFASGRRDLPPSDYGMASKTEWEGERKDEGRRMWDEGDG